MRVEFLNWQGHGLIEPSSPVLYGGAEVRALTFAEGLAGRPGFEVGVAMLVEQGPPREERWGRLGLRLQKVAPRPRSWQQRLAASSSPWRLPLLAAGRLPGFRYVWQLQRPDPGNVLGAPPVDAVCAFGVNDRAACAVAACRRRRIPSLLFVACDHDLSAGYRRGVRHRGPYGERGHLCRFALTRSDVVVVQTEAQRLRLLERFGRKGVLIRNPIDLSGFATASAVPEKRYALWIGRADTVQKRPDLCLELARGCPEIPFRMILNRGQDATLFERLVASAPANVEIVERVPYAEMDAQFRAAAVLVSTSVLEGFPNVFLQAGRHRLPILSWEADPDGFLERHGCGVVARGRMEPMIDSLRTLWHDREPANAMGDRCRRYVESWHDLEGRIDELVEVLRGLDRRESGRRRGAVFTGEHR